MSAQQLERRAHRATSVAMATLVTVEVVTDAIDADVRPALDRALRWFAAVERACSRFDPNSELRRLVARVDEPVAVGPILFETLRFALALAAPTDGAFDPTVGAALQDLGFDRHYATGESSAVGPLDRAASYCDVEIDQAAHTVRLARRLMLDLGAVAKGLAVDLAARELEQFGDFCVEAGGDLFAAGSNPRGEPWRVGVQDPRATSAIVDILTVDRAAVCTSGDYERRTANGAAHHLVDARTGRPAEALASVTVVAPTAMAADGLATAAFVLGVGPGMRLLEDQGVAGTLITPSGVVHRTDKRRRLVP